MTILKPAAIGSKPKRSARDNRLGAGKRGYKLPRPESESAQPLSRYSPAARRAGNDQRERDILTVQGQKASDLEERTYRMLKRLGWTDSRVHFQVSILGGRRPGGQVLDFVLYGFGVVHVLAVNGDYWHAVGRKAEVTRMNENITRRVMPSAHVHSLFNADLLTDEIAYNTLKRLVGRGS